MPGGNHPKGSSQKPSSSSSHRKTRWESGNNATSEPKSGDSKPPKPSSNPSPKPAPTPSPSQPKHRAEQIPHSGPGLHSPGAPFPFSDPSAMGPPPPPAYGFHMLERRAIVLADGSVRSYFALPPDYQDFAPPLRFLDPAGRFMPMGPGRPDLGGFDKRFPPGVPMSPDEFRVGREDLFWRGRHQDYWNSLGLDGRGGPSEGSAMKRKFGDEDEKGQRDANGETTRQRQHFVQQDSTNGFIMGPGDRRPELSGTSSPRRGDEPRASKYIRIGGDYGNQGFRQGDGLGNKVAHKHLEVDQNALKKAFLHFVKVINENASQRKKYLEDGKHGRLQCVACARSSRDFQDMHGLVMHTYNSDNADLHVDHLGLHKALCVLMGWNYSIPPDNSKGYQFLAANEAAANLDDLIMWPPMVIIHNTITGKVKDGRMEGLGNKAMDSKIRDLGFMGGKSKSLYGRDGHLGITLIKFSGDQSGINEAMRLADFFRKDNHGREAWARVQSSLGKDDEKNPNFVKTDEKTGEKKRIFYGYIGTAADLDKLDFETRKKITIESVREFKPST